MGRESAEIKQEVLDTLTGILKSKWRVSAKLAQDLDIEIPEHFRDPKLNPGLEVTPLQLVLSKMVERACQGHDKSIQEVLDRTVGKAAQHIETKSTVTYLDYVEELAQEPDPTPVLVRETPKPDTSDQDDAAEPEIEVNFDAVEAEDELLDELGQM